MTTIVSILAIRDAAHRAAAQVRAGRPMPINPFGEGTDARAVWAETVEMLLVDLVEQEAA